MIGVRSIVPYFPSVLLAGFAAVMLLIEDYVSSIPIPSNCAGGSVPGPYCVVPVGTLRAITQLENELFIAAVLLFAASAGVAVLTRTLSREKRISAVADRPANDGSAQS
jgi:hypothetical protein